MADRYWVGIAGTWNTSSTTVWSTAAPLSLATASCSGTTLTTTGSPALVIGMTVWSSGEVSLGTITGGSGNTWTVSVGGTYASQTMIAATTGASVPTAADNVFFTMPSAAYTVTLTGALACNNFEKPGTSVTTILFVGTGTLAVSGSFSCSGDTVWTATGTISFVSTTTGQTVKAARSNLGVGMSCSMTFNGVGGAWTLIDLIKTVSSTITLTNGSLDTAGFSVEATSFSSSNSNTRSLTLGASTLTLSSSTTPWNISIATGMTFNSGTSTITCSGALSGANFYGGGLTYNTVSFTSNAQVSSTINDANTFNTLSITARTGGNINVVTLAANQTISTFTLFAGSSAINRTFLRSNISGTPRTLTVTTFTAGSADIDFRDIIIAGTAAPISGTRFGDCKGNSGITFDAGKTVYWNLAGNQNWTAIAWALSAGGLVNVNNFPLAQDTAIFTSTSPASGATITISLNWNIGALDMSARTSNTMTLATGATTPTIYGNWVNGTGTTLTGTGQITFGGRSTQTITAAGKTFTQGVTINSPTGTVTLQDALTTSRALAGAVTLTNGTLDLNGLTLTLSATATATFLTATGTKNLTFNGGTLVIAASGATAFNNAVPTGFTTTAGTGTGTISLTSASAKTFSGNGAIYNCTLNQGGAGTLTINDSNTFGNINNTYSTTGATTITVQQSRTQICTNFTATGTIGKVLTLNTSGGITFISVSVRPSTLNYIAATNIVANFAPLYLGTGSTVTTCTNVFASAYVAPGRYWVGGTGTWDTTSTTNWSISSGGASGTPVPFADDPVYFDQAGTYTVTRTGALTCFDLTVSAGTVTFSSTGTLTISGSLTLLAGTVWSATGANTFNAISTGKTITTNGVTISGSVTFNGVGGEWTLGSALTVGGLGLANGTLNTSASNYSITHSGNFAPSGGTLTLNGSTFTTTGSRFQFGVGTTLNAGTSTFNFPNGINIFEGGGKTFNNITCTNYFYVWISPNIISNFTFTNGSYNVFALAANLNITTFVASGTSLTSRLQIRGDAITFAGMIGGIRSTTPRTLTVDTWVTKQYIDFRDITAAGTSIPWSGTSFGDCAGNSNITFPAPKTVYWNLAGSNNWTSNGWAATSGGSPSTSNYPLAQDTAVIDNSSAGSAINSIGTFNGFPLAISSISTSSRTSAFTLNFGDCQIYGNLTTGSGITYGGGRSVTFAGGVPQTISTNGKDFSNSVGIQSISTVTLQDAWTSIYGIGVTEGTFDANNFAVTVPSFDFSSFNASCIVVVNFGSATWTITGSGNSFNTGNISRVTATGSGTINLTSASAKTFSGGGYAYSGITVNQGGAGALTINGSNTFNNITNTYSATGATSILFTAATTSTFTNWNASGSSGRLLTIGSFTAAQHTLFKASGIVNADYLSISRSTATGGAAWYAGANSTDGGNNTGWIFSSPSTGNFFAFF